MKEVVVEVHEDYNWLSNNETEPHENISHSGRQVVGYYSQGNLANHPKSDPHSEHLERHTDQILVEKRGNQEYNDRCLRLRVTLKTITKINSNIE